MPKHGKKYAEAAKLIDKTKSYPILEAAELVKKVSYAKFDASVETSFRLNVDPRHADEQIRGAMVLPHGTGRTQRVLVITQGPKEQEAKDAGADMVGGAEMLEKIKGGWFDFDVIVATPDMMGKLGKLGKVLGPKGLMPNPKAGTVTMDVVKAVNEVKAGKIEYRLDKSNIIHCPVGKVSFGAEKIEENIKALMEAIIKAKPAAAKGQYIKNCSIATTMGPGIKVNAQKFA